MGALTTHFDLSVTGGSRLLNWIFIEGLLQGNNLRTIGSSPVLPLAYRYHILYLTKKVQTLTELLTCILSVGAILALLPK